MTYSFTFILSVMSDIDKNIPLVVCGFYRNEVDETHLVFQKKRLQSFILEELRVVSRLREKFIFLNPFGTNEISRTFKLSVYIHVVLLVNFPENLNYAFYLKCSKRYKVL